MTNRKLDLHDYATYLADSEHRGNMASTIEKELLHYEILDSLSNSGLLDRLVFQGGTSLRLCYGAERYSEDLDFSGGRDFDAQQLNLLKESVEQAVAGRYNVETVVKPPKKTSGLISAWTVIVDTTPKHKDIARQRIKIEVAAIDAHDPVIRPLNINYDELSPSYSDLMLQVESRNEILADKIESFVCSDHLRYRDLWDILWLKKQPGTDMDAIKKLQVLKENDYGETKKFKERIGMVPERLAEAFDAASFEKEMSRFLPADKIIRTIRRPLWLKGSQNELLELFREFTLEQAINYTEQSEPIHDRQRTLDDIKKRAAHRVHQSSAEQKIIEQKSLSR